MDYPIQSEQILDIVKALAKAQGEMGTALFDKKNPHFRTAYASYAALRKACTEALSQNGLAVTHSLMVMQDNKRLMVTQLAHISGQWMRSYLILPQDKETPQGVGSGITYAKRYTLESLIGLSVDDNDDDDGNEAEKGFVKETGEIKAKAPAPQPANDGPKFSAQDALKIEEALKDHPDVRKNMLNNYKAKSFTEVLSKHSYSIWAAINGLNSKNEKDEEIPF